MDSFPLVTFIVTTFNSERTIKSTLDSINRQSYPKKSIEVLIIDGLSTDKTLEIVGNYGHKIIVNPNTDYLAGKALGYFNARGKYLVFLDSDEALENRESIQQRIEMFNKYNKIKGVLVSGYKRNLGSNPINDYINEFGDPFSLFVYKQSKGDGNLIPDLDRNYKITLETDKFKVYSFPDISKLPLIELWAGGCMVDAKYLKTHFPKIVNQPELLPHLFYLINADDNYIAVMKNDAVIHNSCLSVSQYKKKILARVKNNVYGTNISKGGYKGRESITNGSRKFRKVLFIPYSLSVVFPLIDGVNLALTKRKWIFLLHPYLCLFTSTRILYYQLLKMLHVNAKINPYGK